MRRYLWLGGLMLATAAQAATLEQEQDYVACERHHTMQTGPIYPKVGMPPVMVTAPDLAHYVAGWEACAKVQTFWDAQPAAPDLTAVPPDDATVQARIANYP